MEKDFWLERWQRGETGFHQDKVNPYLRQYWPTLNLAPDTLVFVPLCGKSRDMLWLREQGHAVLGVELSPLAVEAFFAENELVPQHSRSHAFDCCEADGFRLLCGDFFDLDKTDLAGVGAVYDRASLVALPPELRRRYVERLLALLPAGTPILLVTFDYPQHEMAGPPFAVTPAEVDALFGNRAAVKLLAQESVLEQNARFRERGLSHLRENIFLLTTRV
ncbi:MAG: thiopurine S-methyltransferase [Pseudomonadota bacterium]